LRQVLSDCPFLRELEEDPGRVLVWRMRKTGLNGFQKAWPGGELVVTGEPLKPCQCWALHVGGDGKLFRFGGGMVGKKLGDFENPP